MGIDFSGIVEELNRLSTDYQVGELQQVRWDMLGRRGRRSGMRLEVHQVDDPDYAFHWGGRTELQFNVGLEDASGVSRIRYGVAFSISPSRTYPINQLRDLLAPKIERFNEFLRWNSDEYAAMKMWNWTDAGRSNEYPPAPIRSGIQNKDVFIFLGRIGTLESWNPCEALKTLDKLLPLYEYVQSDGSSSIEPLRRGENKFSFKPGCTIKLSNTTGESGSSIYNIRLRHNQMQRVLYDKLASKHGADNVGTENQSGNGVRIDVVLRNKNDSYMFYEIKTAREPRICIREAIGQLLEYAFWSDSAQEPTSLVVVGPNPIDEDGKKYLNNLKKKFRMPIKYDHL